MTNEKTKEQELVYEVANEIYGEVRESYSGRDEEEEEQ